MPTFKICVTETLQRIIEVEEETFELAIEQIQDSYRAGLTVLDSNDFMDYSIEGVSDDEA